MVRFGQELIDVQSLKRSDVALEYRRAANQDRLERLLALDPAADVDTGEHRQVQIEQDQIEWSQTREELDALRSIGGLDDLEPFTPQEFCDQAAQEVLILDQQELPRSSPVHGPLLMETGRILVALHPDPAR